MTSEWSEVPLGDVITLQRGFDLPAQERQPGKVPIVSSSGISDFHSEIRVKGPGVVTGRYGTIGQVFLIKQDYWPLNTTLWVKDFHGNDPQFTSYLLRTVDFGSCSDKSSVPGVNRNDLHRIPVLLPPLAEQKAIAGVLGALDDKIELNRRMNATLEAMARALFQSWFVDFDPVRAKLDGRQFEGIDPQVFRMLPDKFETTEDGIVPTGWKFRPLTEVYDVSSGLSKPRAEFGFGHPFLTFTNVMNNRFIPQSLTSLVNSSDAERSRCTVERGDVFLTRTSETQEELGMSCAALQSYPQATFNGFTKRLRPKGASPLLPEYAGFYFRSAKFRRDVTAMSSLSTRASLNNEMLSRLKVLLPQAFICEAFANYVSPLLRRMQANEVESKQLATLRDTLLPKLLSGELSVAGAAQIMEHA